MSVMSLLALRSIVRLRQDANLVWATLATGPATGEVDSCVVAETVKVMVYGF